MISATSVSNDVTTIDDAGRTTNSEAHNAYTSDLTSDLTSVNEALEKVNEEDLELTEEEVAELEQMLPSGNFQSSEPDLTSLNSDSSDFISSSDQTSIPSFVELAESSSPPIPLIPSFPAAAEPLFAASVIHGRSVSLPYTFPPPVLSPENKSRGSIPVASLHIRSAHLSALNMFTHFALHAASALGVPISTKGVKEENLPSPPSSSPSSSTSSTSPTPSSLPLDQPFPTAYAQPLPTRTRLWTVPSGPFAHKKSQINFQRRLHARTILAVDAAEGAVERWLTYVLGLHPVPGVGVRVTRWIRAPIGVGRSIGAKANSAKQSVGTNKKKILAGHVDKLNDEGATFRQLTDVETDRQKVEALAKEIIEQESAAAGLPSPNQSQRQGSKAKTKTE